jgi:hypothetical protein
MERDVVQEPGYMSTRKAKVAGKEGQSSGVLHNMWGAVVEAIKSLVHDDDNLLGNTPPATPVAKRLASSSSSAKKKQPFKMPHFKYSRSSRLSMLPEGTMVIMIVAGL